MDRLFQHAVSDKLGERQMVGKLLIIIFQNAVKSKLCVNPDEVFQPVLEHVIHDKESTVRSSLVECLPHVALLYQESPYLFGENLVCCILTIILVYLRDEDNQVRQDAQTALRMLLERKLLDDDQIQNSVCGVIIQLSRHSGPEFQTLALTLMTKVSPHIGDELTEKLFLDRFIELCTSESFFVRRVCASIMGEFCTIMSDETVHNKLLPIYANLCQDSVWGVRKTSVDVMMSVARCVPLLLRRRLLSKLLVNFLNDESRWVRRSAYEILGPFISTFAKQFHELVYDPYKGELLVVHQYEGGWQRWNVVPVTKTSDILAENLSNMDNNSCKANSMTVAERFSGKGIRRLKLAFNNNRSSGNPHTDTESAKFNTFQYYYDPPNMPLDPALVNSIIDDNVATTMAGVDAKVYCDENDGNDNANDEKTDRKKDTNENIDNSEELQLQQDSNDDIDVKEQQQQERINRIREQENKQNEDGGNNEEEVDDEEDEKDDDGHNNKTSEQYTRRRILERVYPGDLSRFRRSQVSLNSSLSNLNNTEDDDADEIVPRILVDHFVSMAEQQNPSNDVGPDLDYHCAFSFPAVVLTLGKENWHRLKDAYKKLASAVPWKVRSTLASSIHEIAIIIEKEYAARDLVPIYNGFIKDLDEVRIGAIRHFFTFLQHLSPQDRMQYLLKLNDFLITDNKWNWRLREELVKQLWEIIHLYQRIDVSEYIAPLLLHLLQDRVAAVRQEALYAVDKTIAYLACHRDDPLAIAMIQEMRDLLMMHAEKRWVIRQTYALLCSKLASNMVVSGEVFAKELLPYLLELYNDKVPNVRLVVARTLARDVVRITDFPNAELMKEVQQKLKIMQSDCDRDVRIFASEAEPDQFY
ncbi:serine/threonine-protein phosphatase 4 regulatory subunit 1 isoform X2 [Nasonia vitripennis]|nr:serine/threonine-protein phosphatase 4 regulatory subunit 1 isoform X2 [Nasonia vitripennis]